MLHYFGVILHAQVSLILVYYCYIISILEIFYLQDGLDLSGLFHCNLSNDILFMNFINFLRYSFVSLFLFTGSFLFLISQLSKCLFLYLVICSYTTNGLFCSLILQGHIGFSIIL